MIPILPGWVQDYSLIWLFFLMLFLVEFTDWVDKKWKE